MRLAWGLGGIVLVAVVGGCTSHSGGTPIGGTTSSAAATAAPVTAESAPPFSEPGSYGFVLARGCDDTALLGRYRVTVQGGAVTKSERLDAAVVQPQSSSDVDLGPAAGDGEEEIEVPTLAELAEMAQTAADDGGKVTRVFDSKDGRPVKVTINVSDDGDPGATECFAISEYAPAS
ncbi:hypothetical protein ACWKSP_31930 [Micromonosporaceae bacterium Da 78-11]